VGKHQKRIAPGQSSRFIGDAYTFIGLERTSKLVVAWHLGKRDRVNTEDFVSKIRWATAPGWFDVSTDGFQPYETAIDAGLYDRANHSQVVKVFSNTALAVPESYRPAIFISIQKDVVSGTPDLDRAGTSHVERKNGTLRQWCKRLTRLTYAFSRKWENLRAALALHFCHYKFLSDSWFPEDHASDGGGDCGSRVGYFRFDWSVNDAEEPNRGFQRRDREDAVHPALCIQGWQAQLHDLVFRSEPPFQVRHFTRAVAEVPGQNRRSV
jgi:IS1 family transposase